MAATHFTGPVVSQNGFEGPIVFSPSTVVAMEDIGDAINTTGKYPGKMVVVLASGLIFTASGAAAGDTWFASDGTTTAVPV